MSSDSKNSDTVSSSVITDDSVNNFNPDTDSVDDTDNDTDYYSTLRIIKMMFITFIASCIIRMLDTQTYMIKNVFIPMFPYPLAIYSNVNNIVAIDSDNGLSTGNRIRLTYLINHENNLEQFIRYISKLDNRLLIMFRGKNNQLNMNIMDINNKMELLSGKEYKFNTLQLINKPANLSSIYTL
jgi:hypothetical protein